MHIYVYYDIIHDTVEGYGASLDVHQQKKDKENVHKHHGILFC